MSTVKVSPKYQVVIPLDVRRVFNIHPGEKFQVLLYENRIEFIPVRKLKEMRGFLKGINPVIERNNFL